MISFFSLYFLPCLFLTTTSVGSAPFRAEIVQYLFAVKYNACRAASADAIYSRSCRHDAHSPFGGKVLSVRALTAAGLRPPRHEYKHPFSEQRPTDDADP